MTDQEINEAVARKLGWKYIAEPHMEDAPHIPYNRWLSPDGQKTSSVDDYCHSIAAAWEVVEKLSPVHGIGLTQHLQPPYGFTCIITTAQTEESSFFYRADTAPMAICLAFLKLR